MTCVEVKLWALKNLCPNRRSPPTPISQQGQKEILIHPVMPSFAHRFCSCVNLIFFNKFEMSERRSATPATRIDMATFAFESDFGFVNDFIYMMWFAQHGQGCKT